MPRGSDVRPLRQGQESAKRRAAAATSSRAPDPPRGRGARSRSRGQDTPAMAAKVACALPARYEASRAFAHASSRGLFAGPWRRITRWSRKPRISPGGPGWRSGCRSARPLSRGRHRLRAQYVEGDCCICVTVGSLLHASAPGRGFRRAVGSRGRGDRFAGQHPPLLVARNRDESVDTCFRTVAWDIAGFSAVNQRRSQLLGGCSAPRCQSRSRIPAQAREAGPSARRSADRRTPWRGPRVANAPSPAGRARNHAQSTFVIPDPRRRRNHRRTQPPRTETGDTEDGDAWGPRRACGAVKLLSVPRTPGARCLDHSG